LITAESAEQETQLARDPQGALVALNRFGFGARGGASGDFASAATDPRGFVKAELARPNAALLEQPSLRPSPELARAFFAFTAEVRRQRAAEAKATQAQTVERPDVPPAASQAEPRQQNMVRPPGPVPRETPQPVDVVVKTFRGITGSSPVMTRSL
jgi:uncharacterized protein (DUF1800 family)